jgi:hypothetical protein
MTPKERPRGENVVDLMYRCASSVGRASPEIKPQPRAVKHPLTPDGGTSSVAGSGEPGLNKAERSSHAFPGGLQLRPCLIPHRRTRLTGVG